MPRGTVFSTPFFDRFLISFCSQLRSPKTKKSLKFHLFYCIFCKLGLPKLRSFFDVFLVPTWLHFASQNPPKTFQKPTPRGTKILIDFCIVFLSFLAPFWDPSWGHVGHFFGQKWATLITQISFLFQDRFSGPPGSLLAPFGLDFGGFGAPFWRFWVPMFQQFW